MTVSVLPSVNAALNLTSALLLLAGLCAIRARRTVIHQCLMLGACLASLLFLVSYVCYHARVGSVRFPGTGWIRAVYLAVLLTHTVLAIAIVPLVARVLYLAGRGRFAGHASLARWTWPFWLYVSVTGVVVYWWLYRVDWTR